MSLLPEDVQEQLEHFKSTVEALKRNALTLTSMLALPQPVASTPVSSNTYAPDTLPHLERAQVLLALGQNMHALHQMHMRASGLDPQKHYETDIHKENERLAAYKKKVAKAVAAHELATSKPTISLNVSAANRFIDHAIPDLNPEQRRLLKEQSVAGKRQAEEQSAGDRLKKARGAFGHGNRDSVKGGSKQGGRGGRNVKDHAISFLNAVLQEGLGSQQPSVGQDTL